MAIGDLTGTGREPYVRYGRRRPAAVAGLLSAIVPGAGQLFLGHRLRGIAMLTLTAVVAGLVLASWIRGPVFVLRLLVRPDVLLALLVANTLAFGLRAYAVVDAVRLARDRAPARGAVLPALLITALLALTAAPHVVAGYYDFRSYDLITSVFAQDEPDDPAPLAEPEPSAAPSEPQPPVPEPQPGPEPVVAPGPVSIPGETEPAPQDGPSRSAVNPDRLDAGKRLNLLLVGGDAGVGRSGLRTDTMIVFSIDPDTAHAAVFSIPRNLLGVPIPDSAHTEMTVLPNILNALWQYAEWYGWYPDSERPGATALKETIGNLLDLEIDYYAAVDLRGFVEVIDALDGVTVSVQRYVYDAGVSSAFEGEAWTPIDLAPGEHHLDGRQALAYVRTRWATSDYDRMQRQRCLMASVAQQAGLKKLLGAFPKLASTMKEFVLTDVPVKALPDLIELAVRMETKTMVGVSLVPPRFSGYADVDEIRAAVKEALRAGPTPNEEIGLVGLAGDCA